MQHLVDFPGSAARVIASCTDADEEPAPGAPEPSFEGLPDTVEAAFEREEGIASDEDQREVWLDQLPFFAPTAEGVEAVRAALARRRLSPRLDAPRGWGDLHALTALATSEIPVLAIAGEHDRGTPPAAARRIAATAPRASWWSSTASGTSRSPRRPRPTGAPCAAGSTAPAERSEEAGPGALVSGSEGRRGLGGRDRAGRQQRGEDGRSGSSWADPPAPPARGNAPIG